LLYLAGGWPRFAFGQFYNMTITLLNRLKNVLRGRTFLDPNGQLILECKEEIERLERQRIIDLERAAQIVEDFDADGKTVVGRLRIAARKAEIAEKIRDLK
jgi:hypothetical protein